MVAMPTLGPFLGGANDLAKAAVQETAAQRTYLAAHATKSQRFDLGSTACRWWTRQESNLAQGFELHAQRRPVARNRPAAD